MTHTHSTSEELIVSYLDGELARKELEVELFERLATQEEARTLLREYLVMRGAIKASRNDARFELSHDVDQRTRARLEQLLVSVPALAAPVLAGPVADRAAVPSNVMQRSLNRWKVRASVVATLLVLLAIGSTWYLTHTSDEQRFASNESMKASQPVSTQQPVIGSQKPVSTQPATDVSTASKNFADVRTEKPAAPTEHVRIVKEYIHDAPVQQSQQPTTAVTVEPKQSDPRDAMPSHRFAKMIGDTRTVVVTAQDRL